MTELWNIIVKYTTRAEISALSYCNNYPLSTTALGDLSIRKGHLSQEILQNKLTEESIQRLIAISVRGVTNVLKACTKAKTVLKVIMTSCTSALYDQPPLLDQTTEHGKYIRIRA